MMLPPVFSMASSLLGGALTDRFGRRPLMLIGTLVQMLMFALFAGSTSPWVDFVAFIGIGLGGALYRPASSAMVADSVPPDQLRQVFATFMTANNIGAVLGPALGAIFFFQYRQPLLWTCTLVMLVYLFAICFVVNETLPVTAIVDKTTSTIANVFKEQWKGYGVIFRDKVFLVYIFAGIFSLISIMQLDIYLPVYIIHQVPAQSLFAWNGASLTLSSTEIYGWLVGFNGLLFVLFILPVTKWFQHWKERNVFILSSLLSGIGTFMVGLNTNIWALFIVTVIFTFGEIVRSPVTQSFISRYAPEHARGQYMAADSLQNTVGKFLAPLTVFFSKWVPPIGIFSIILILSLISIILYFLLFRMYSENPSAMD